MAVPKFPSVGADGKIRTDHLPDYLREEEIIALVRRAGTVSPGMEMLASKLAFGGAGQHTIAVVADSTMNDNNEAVRIFDRLYGALLPTSVRHVYHRWLPASNAWEHTVNQEGTITPASDGKIVDDTFTRTVTDLVGSTPDTGPAWVGTTGTWSANGSQAVATSAGQLRTDAGVRNITLEIDLDLVTTATGTAQSHRYYLGSSPTSSTTGLWVTVNITTTGTVSWALWLTSGSSSQIGATKYGGTIGIGSNKDTPQKMSLRAEIDIQNVTATMTSATGSETITGTITESQYGALGTSVTLNSLGPSTGIRLDRVRVSVPPQPASGDMLDVWNGAIAGAKFSTFNTTKLDQMFDGVHVDVLMLSMGHNNGTQAGSDFVTEVDTWVDLWISKHPETQGIVWISQNPQFPPATSIAAHRERQLAMRVAAKEKWEYIPGYEAFVALPDGGQSMVGADGIHPTTPPTGTVGDYGAVLMADTILDAIRARV